MLKIIEDCSDPNLAKALETNWYGVVAQWASTPPREIYEDRYLKRVFTGVPSPSRNRVFLTHLTPDNLDEKIRETIQYFKSREMPFSWWVGPTSKPLDLGHHLENHGLTHESSTRTGRPCMAVELESLNEGLPKPSGLTIELVEDVETLRNWALILVVGFGGTETSDSIRYWFDLESKLGFDRPLKRYRYIGYLNGEPVATALIFLGAGVAGIYAVATVPEARRMGIGTEMTLKPLKEARDMGYRVGVLGSSEMGYGVYRRLGFEEYWKMSVYIWKE